MKVLLIALLTAILASFGCTSQTVNNPPPAQNENPATAQNPSTAPAKPESPAPAKTEVRVITKGDTATANKVKSRLTSISEPRGAMTINIETNEGVVTLTGTVPSAAMKARVEQIVKETEGVTRVVDNLTVDTRLADTGTGKTTETTKPNDAAILTKINSQLVTEGIKSANVAVTDGYVLLKGEVAGPEEKARAEAIAQRTEGVRGVTSQLTVKKGGGKVDDAAIMTKVQSQLVVEGITGVNVAVSNGYVLLKGEVDSPRQKADAETIARRIEGVRGVTNELAVKRIS